MDDLSVQYLRMANGPQGQLHDPAAVVNFVEQMQLVVERSSAPRKNFLLDTTTPRGDVIITEASAMKSGNGWITLQVTEGIRRGVHEWCVKIEHQGETTDGSGLMLGIVPKTFAKYDSFISQGGGWCLSRAGKFYGHWRRQDNNSSVVFGTGDRIIFLLDYEAARMTVRVGDKSVVGEISNLASEVYPAISLHYRHQFVRFEYHKIHDRHAKKLNWIERFAFPHAAVYLPLTPEQLEKVPLDSYVFSSLFNEKEGQTARRRRQKGSAGFYSSSSPSSHADGNVAVSEEYETRRATSARLTIVLRAILAMQRYSGGGLTPVEAFLHQNITAETLRKQQQSLLNRSTGSRVEMDAALNCGALVLIHMFAHANMTLEGTTVLPLIQNLQDYLRGVKLFSLGEASPSPYSVGTSISPEVVRQALDSVAKLLERAIGNMNSNGSNDRSTIITSNSNSTSVANNNNSNSNSHYSMNSIMNRSNYDRTDGGDMVPALLELLVLLSLHSGAISEILRSVRYLLHLPSNIVSQETLTWLKENEAALTPKRFLPSLNEAYDAMEEDAEQLTPFGRDFNSTVLSVGYNHDAVYIHNVDGLCKHSNVVGMFALVYSTSEPSNCCLQCTSSSIAFSETGGLLFLLTNRMVAAGIAVITYGTVLLDVRQKVALTDVHHWPLSSHYMLLTSGPGDCLLLVYDVGAVASSSLVAADPNNNNNINNNNNNNNNNNVSSAAPGLEIQVFDSTKFPELRYRTSLQLSPFDRSLAYCLSLRKGGVVDFGSPETGLATVGGHVTIEVWIKILEKDDTSVFYQHGDRSTSGEVFLETTRLEGAWRIRGGYRHDSRGMCVVSAPVSPASESHFIHVVLVFDGNWRLYLDNEEVSCTRQGPQVSLENPRQRWTAGNDCVCEIAALRVWKGSRSFREIARDSCRLLSGNEPNLLCQYLFNEPNGNVVFNHVHAGAAVGHHAIVRGKFAHVACFDHPLTPCVREGGTPVSFPLGFPQLGQAHAFYNGVHLGLVERRERVGAGFTDGKHVHQVTFFDVKTGRTVYGSYVLQQRSKMGFLGCDHTGKYWELFRAGVSSAAPGGGGQQQQQQQHVVAVGRLATTSAAIRENDIFSSFFSSKDSMYGCDNDSNGGNGSTSNGAKKSKDNNNVNSRSSGEALQHHGARLHESNPPQGGQQQQLLHLNNVSAVKLSFGSLAMWLLNLLSSFAEASSTDMNNHLFSPLLDDVGIRCVQEVQQLLSDHCRSVWVMNARRAAKLKDKTSSTVISTSLRVLLRLVRRVRDFKLHPDTIGLSEVTGCDDQQVLLHELTIVQRRRSSSWQECVEHNTAEHNHTMNNNNNSRANEMRTRRGLLQKGRGAGLLGVLGDIINEAGFNLPIELAVFARVIIQEGVTLFFPSATVRTKLLREILDREQQNVSSSPALTVLLDAIVKSFTDITSAAALVYAVDPNSQNNNNNQISEKNKRTECMEEKLVGIKTTLFTLLAESAYQMTSNVPSDSIQQQMSLISTMAEAVGTLQLLLFSQCCEIGISDMSNVVNTRCGIENIFSFPLSTRFCTVLKEYYAELFNKAELIFKALRKRILSAATTTTMSSSASMKSTTAAATPPAAATTTRIVDMMSISFVGYPLHTAITALPFMVTRQESESLLQKLNSLHVEYCSLLKVIRENTSKSIEKVSRWPLPVLDNGLLLASSWVASFMSLGQLSLVEEVPETTNESLSSSSQPYSCGSKTSNVIQDICDHPLLAGGLRSGNYNKNNSCDSNKGDRDIMEKLRQERSVWESIANKEDPLSSKTPREIAAVMSLASVAIVHLSGVEVRCLPEKERHLLLARTLLRLKSARNELLNQRSKHSNDFSKCLQDVQERCLLLLRMRRVCEADFLKLPCTVLAQSFADRVLQGKRTNRYRWKRAVLTLRAERMYHENFINSWPPLQIDSALKLVERIILSSGVTTSGLQATLQARQTTALQRLDGLRHMLHLFEKDTKSALKVASLFFSGSVGSHLQFEVGISGCLDSTRCAIRRTMYDILKHLRDATAGCALTARMNDKAEESAGKKGGNGAAPYCLATLSGVLNRNWLPSDFCYLENLHVVKVIFENFCSIFQQNDTETLRQERAAERIHRYDARDARKQTHSSSRISSGTTEEEANEVSLLRTPYENALMESLTALKSLGQQCAKKMGEDKSLSLCERRGCIFFLDGLFEVLELELLKCAKYASQTCYPAQDRVLEQVSLICTLTSTVARTLPEHFFCSKETCPKLALLAFRLCIMAKTLLGTTTTTVATSTATSITSLNLIDVCINTSVLLLSHCQPSTVDSLFLADETMEMTRQSLALAGGGKGGETLGFLFAFALGCISYSNNGINEIGMRCVAALHTLICSIPWDESFMSLYEPYQIDLRGLSASAANEEVARSNSIRLLLWMYAIGGPPTVLLSLGKKVQTSVDNMLTSTEGAYIVDLHAQSNSATVISSTLYSFLEEREVLLDNLMNAADEKVILPRANVLFRFLLPTLENFFKPPLKPHLSPLVWAVVAALLRITKAVLQNDPAASQILLEQDIISHIDAFAFRLTAKVPLPLCYLYDVCPTVVGQLLQCTRRISFDAVVPSSSGVNSIPSASPSSAAAAAGGGGMYNQASPRLEFQRAFSFGSVTPLPTAVFGASPAMCNPSVTRSGFDGNNNNNNNNNNNSNNGTSNMHTAASGGLTPSLVRLPQTHSSLCLTPSVLCFRGAKDAPVGTLTMKSTSSKSCLPLWTDGLTLETSVLLYERLFPELGEDFVIPVSWQRPQIQFTLFSLFEKKAPSNVPFMCVVVRETSIDCIMEGIKGSTVIVSTKLSREDWDHWMHIALVLESKTITLYKDGSGTTGVLQKGIGSRLESLLREGGVERLVIGNEMPPGGMMTGRKSGGSGISNVNGCDQVNRSGPGRSGSNASSHTANKGGMSITNINSSDNDTTTGTTTNTANQPQNNNEHHSNSMSEECTVDGMIVAIESVRIWGCARGLKLQRTTADFVAREQMLPSIAVYDGSHTTFRFSEATGDETFSENKESVGILRGHVRWAPFPVFSGTVDLDRASRTDPTKKTDLPLFIPRHEFEGFFEALDLNQLLRIGSEYLQTLCAHVSRQCVVAAICQMVSPGYHVLVMEKYCKKCENESNASSNKTTSNKKKYISPPSITDIVNPRFIIGSNDLIRHIINLLRYSDTGVVDDNIMIKISDFIKLWFRSIQSESMLMSSFCETAFSIGEALHEEGEIFRVELPPLSYVTTDIHLVPVAILNGPGSTLSFDANSRGIEHMTLLRDRKQKVLLAKYPDAQGGWPELEIQNDNIWFYVRPIVSTRASTSSFQITANSLKPTVACGVFGVIRELLTSETKYHCGLSFFLNAPFLSFLTVRTGTMKCSALPACRLLTALFDLWRQMPHFAPHDQSPLKIVLAHLNAPLMSILHRGQLAPNSSPLFSPSLGHYNLRVQGAFELLVAAIRLEAAWKNVLHHHCTRHRWKRLYTLWESSIGYGAPVQSPSSVILSKQDPTVLERGYVRLVPLPTSGSPVQHRPKATIFQRGNGVWSASCDRISLSARSNIGFKRGRFYFEVRIPATGEAISVGVVTERAKQNSLLAPRGLGHDGDSWGFESVQMCRFYHGFRHEFAVRTKWKPMDVIGILLDLEAETLACVHDNRQVSLFDNLRANRGNDATTSFFPAVSFGIGGVDVNFGAAPFSCALPVGFLPVDPSNYMTSPTSKLWSLLTAVDVGEVLERSEDMKKKINNNNNNNSIGKRISTTTATTAIAVKNNSRRDSITLCKEDNLLLPSLFEKAIDVGMLYQRGRSGPFSVSLLPCDNKMKTATIQGSEVSAEDDPCFVRGSVCVRSGRWYYEVALRGEALVSVGWVVSTATPDWSRTKSLGDDNESWVFEGSRTTARHNKHQRSVGGQMWKHGDIVGCMLDCDAGVIAYSVNGVPLREMHDTNGDGVLFSSVNCANGLMPVIGVDPRNAASILFSDYELSYRPSGYRALGTINPMRIALEQYYCTGDVEKKDNNVENGGVSSCLFSPALARSLLLSLTSLTELNFMNVSAYCLEDVLNKNSSTIRYEKFQGRENALRLLVTLQNISALTESMIPYAHAALTSGEYDILLSGPICRSLGQCREYMLPVVALRVLHSFFVHTNCVGENVKLTLNRRKALSLVNDMNVPVSERLRGSLFGQVYHLLHDKNVSLFCTSKKLWSVNFVGEGADDIGGPYRESITQLCSELMSPGLPLFIPSPNQINEVGDSRELFVVRPTLEPPVRLIMYHFFGRLIAGSLRSSEPLPIYLPSRIWKTLVGSPVDESDLSVVDKITLQSYQYIRQLVLSNKSEKITDEEIAELCPGGFSVMDDAGTEQELFPKSKDVPVSRSNVEIFLDMALRYKLHEMGDMQIKAISEGFHQVIPVSAVSLLKWYELEQVVCGQPDYDADALIDSARYEDLDPQDVIVQYLRQVLREFSRHERALFMRFVSGRERLPSGVRLKLMPDAHSPPVGGDGNFENTTTHGIRTNDGKDSVDTFDDNRLPHASTCFYWLSIPRYSSVEVMREKLLFAIQQCLDIDADFVVHENDNPEDEVEPTLAVNAGEDEEEFEDFSHLR